MGDHLSLLVDHLLTESTLEAAIGSRKPAQTGHSLPLPDGAQLGYGNAADGNSAQKIVECRICQEEDLDTSMEVPCSCCGSLKYAHRKCIQRWCNEKGDTICEICLQQFKPGYTAPQQLFHYGSIPMNFRGNWEIARQELQDSQIITMVPSDRDLIANYDDYPSLRTRSTICCRSVAIVFIALLVLRHTLPLLLSGGNQYSFALFSLLVLRTAGVLFPILVMARALATFHRRRRQQEIRETSSASSSDTEEEDTQMNRSRPIRSQPHLVQVH